MKKLLMIVCMLVSLSETHAQKNGADSRYYRLFAPLAFYHNVAADEFALDTANGDALTREIQRTLSLTYLKRPDLVEITESEMAAAGELRSDIEAPIEQHVTMTEETGMPEPEFEPEVAPVEMVIEKPQFWTLKGDGNLQFLQNYVSDNWYKGGESNYAAVGALTVEANYDDKARWKWDNKLEMKLGLQTSPSDTVHKYKTNEDLLRLTSKVGLQATKHWYYTIQMLAYTQFARGLKANKEATFSDFMSPFNLNVGIGMDYKVEWLGKRITGTINMSPLAVNYRYVDRTALAKSFGVKDHHTHSLTDFGSQLTASLEWKMNDVVTWKSRLYGFTSYHRAEMEWENTFQLKVSRFITANLFLFPRFDDSNIYDEKLGFWQFKEYSSLGFSYNF